MSDVLYPEIDEKAIILISEFVSRNPGYLEESPYSEEFKNIFNSTKVSVDVNDIDELVTEIITLSDQLKAMGDKIEKLEPSEKNTYFRTRFALLEKRVELIERAANVNRVKEFYDTIVRIFEEELRDYPDIKTSVMERIDDFRK